MRDDEVNPTSYATKLNQLLASMRAAFRPESTQLMVSVDGGEPKPISDESVAAYVAATREAHATIERELGPSVLVNVADARRLCARCNADLGALTDGNVDAVITAHQDRCFVGGDVVRYDHCSVTGTIQNSNGMYFRLMVTECDAAVSHLWHPGSILNPHRDSLRRIPRPQPGDGDVQLGDGDVVDAATYALAMSAYEADTRRVSRPQQDEVIRSAHAEYVRANPHPVIGVDDMPLPGMPDGFHIDSVSSGPRQPNLMDQAVAEVQRRAEIAAPKSPPELYDGIDSATCYVRWLDNRACLERGESLRYEMSPGQIAEAKAAWWRLSGRFDAIALRSMVAASADAERLTVRVELQCDEDLTW